MNFANTFSAAGARGPAILLTRSETLTRLFFTRVFREMT